MRTEKFLIVDEASYWRAHAFYKKLLFRHLRKYKLMINNFSEWFKKFDDILNEMVVVGVVSSDWALSVKKNLLEELSKPEEYKGKVDEFVVRANKVFKRLGLKK